MWNKKNKQTNQPLQSKKHKYTLNKQNIKRYCQRIFLLHLPLKIFFLMFQYIFSLWLLGLNWRYLSERTVRKPYCISGNYFHLSFHHSHLPILSLLFRILYQCFSFSPYIFTNLPPSSFSLTYFSFIDNFFSINTICDRCPPTIGASISLF